MHTGVENHTDRTRTGRLAEVPEEGAPRPCAALPGTWQGGPACPLARKRGLTHLLPSDSEGDIELQVTPYPKTGACVC